MCGDSGHHVRRGGIRRSYQLKQDYLCVDWVRDVIVISIYLRCDNLGVIAGHLGHADLHVDSTPVIDGAWAETQGGLCLTNALVVYVGRPLGK